MAPIRLLFLQGTLIVRSGCVLLHMARDMHEANAMKLAANLLKIRLSAVTMGLLISASLSRAAFIDGEVFTTDTATGLDWLDVTETQGYSYNATLEAISAGGNLVGWRFATINEFYGLIDSAVGEFNPFGEFGTDVAIYDDMVSLVYL